MAYSDDHIWEEDFPSLPDHNENALDFLDDNQPSAVDRTEKANEAVNVSSCLSSADAENPSTGHESEVSTFITQFSFSTDIPIDDAPSPQIPVQADEPVNQHADTQATAIVKSTDTTEKPSFATSSENKVFLFERPNAIGVRVQPEELQHVRYERESKKTLRYNKAADGKPIRIIFAPGLADLWKHCRANMCDPWLRIIRTTVGIPDVLARHPYPIWMKDQEIVAYDGSLYKRITQADMIKGYIEIKNLVLSILKQDHLEKIDSLAIYDPQRTVCAELYDIGFASAKVKIERYHLQQSALHFQIMIADPTKVLSSTDCCCRTIDITEFTGSRPSADSTSKRKRTSTSEANKRTLPTTKCSSNESGHT